MKSLLRRFTGFGISLLGSIFLGTGCGQKEEPVYEEFLVVDVFDTLANYQGLQSGWYAKLIREKFNMQFNIIAPNVAGGGDTLYQMRVTSGNLGDIIICSGERGDLQNMINAGLLYDMSSLLEGKEILAYRKAIESLQESVAQEGIYAIPSEVSRLSADTPSEALEPNYGPYLRWDIYKKIGYPQITDLDSLLEVLEQMQKAAPVADNGNKTYAFSLFKDWDGNLMSNAKQPGCFYGYDEIGFVLAKADGSDYQDILEKDSWYLKALRLFYEANRRGLLDPDSPVQNYEELFEKYQQGEVLFSFWPWLGQSAYNTEEHTREGKGFMAAPMADMQIFSYGCNPEGNHKLLIAIGSQAKDPERLADFIDWLYSPEGIMISGAKRSGGMAGPQGLTWEIQDGMPVLTEFGRRAFYSSEAQLPEEWGAGKWSDGLCELNYSPVAQAEISPSGFSYAYSLWDSVRSEEETTLQREWKEYMDAEHTMDYLKKNGQLLVAPGCSFAIPEESMEIAAKRSQCKNVIVDSSWKLVYAASEEEFQKIYREMVTAANDLGYQDVLALDLENARLQNEYREKALR
ncbi:MAG: extracellular solute-binding protein [Clostridium sp.]|nr:extracellular solute-binding protein [Clostridium sp.]